MQMPVLKPVLQIRIRLDPKVFTWQVGSRSDITWPVGSGSEIIIVDQACWKKNAMIKTPIQDKKFDFGTELIFMYILTTN